MVEVRSIEEMAENVARRAMQKLSDNGVLVGRWIPFSEGLPEPYRQVLRTVKSIGWNGTFNIYVDIGTICPIDTDVIAWMPLPEPYRGGSEKE